MSCSLSLVVVPVECHHGCACHYSALRDENIFNCSSRNLTQLPEIPQNTDWLDLSNNRIHSVKEIHPSYSSVQHLDLSSNNISEFSENLLRCLTNQSSISYLNIAKNKITKLPESITEVSTLKELRLSSNPYQCACDMLWMQRWLYQTSHEHNIIPDSKNITCGPGPLFGTALYELHSDALGCMVQWYIIVVLACVSVAVFVTSALVLHRNWERLKFLLFVHFDILTTDDGVENLDDMFYDAFVSYR